MFETIHHFQQLMCVGGGCGAPGGDADVSFGAAQIDAANVAEKWLVDNVPMHVKVADFSMSSSDQGMFNNYAAIHTTWADTTAMDNLRGADITAEVAGTTETMNGGDDKARAAGHTVHTTTTDCDPRGSVLCPKAAAA